MDLPSPMPRPSSASLAGFTLTVLAVTAVSALVIAGLTVSYQFTLEGSAWRIGEGIRGFRVPLLAQGILREMLLALPLSAAAGFLAQREAHLREAASGTRSARGLPSALPPPVSWWVIWFTGFAAMLVWTASWAVFAGTGSFLDTLGVRMAGANPEQILRHVLALAPAALVATPLLTLVTWEMVRRAVRTTLRWQPKRKAGFLAVSAVGLVSLAVTGEVGGPWAAANPAHVTHPAKGIETTVGDLYLELRYSTSGPVTRTLTARRGTASGWASLQPGPEAALVEWRPRTDWSGSPPETPLNVLVLVVESLRSDELAAYGGPGGVMPAVDAIAQEALVFLDHYANATHTNYSWVVPVSSQYPLWDPVMHVFPPKPDPDPVRLYDVLKPFGYRTAIISSQNELWGGMANFLQSPALDLLFHAETFDGETYIPADDGFSRWAGEFGRAGKIDDAVTVSRAIEWIGHDGDPFVLFMNLQNSHVPYPIPGHAETPFGPRDPGFRIGFNRFPPEEAAAVRGVYRNALHYVDHQVGRLVAHLKSAGVWDRTLVVITGDHGQAFFEHGFAAHGNELFDELLRTPLVIRVPGTPAADVSGLAQHVDVAPTVLGLLGMAPHPGFQGRDLMRHPREFGFALVQTPLAHQYGILTTRHRLVFDPGLDRAVLRDLQADPAELRDFTPEAGELAGRLRSRLDSWRETQLRYYSTSALRATFFPPVPRD